jgi:hypothetical protein
MQSFMNQHTAVFTLSLDCEGLWGTADNQMVVSSGLLTDQSLAKAYQKIISALDRNGVLATAAFVTCFAATIDSVRDQRELLNSAARLNPIWFKSILSAIDTGRMEGWSGNKFYKQMQAAGHEIAWHGATHQPLNTNVLELMEIELALATKLLRQFDQIPETIIFPRNKVGNLEFLKKYGFKSYRAERPASGAGRIASLLSEFMVWDRGPGELPKIEDGWLVSPAGNFLNWPSGARSLVPISVTVQRWRSILRHAMDNGGHVHMWFHPHNLITAPLMAELFDIIIDHVGVLISKGDMVSLTIKEANRYYAEREVQ